MLNAFRHQRMDHQRYAVAFRVACQVLNAFRHQRMDHHRKKDGSSARTVCSTPFGINEWITTTILEVPSRRRLCSTPFGINEWITQPRIATAFSVLGAQRLSASTNGSPSTSVRICAASVCSTPFGINEWITRTVISQTSPVFGAQRLSASTNGSH